MRAASPLLFVTLLVVFLPSCLPAAQIVYTADDLPLDAGWQLILSSSTQNGDDISSVIINDSGANVWRLTDASSTYRCGLGMTLPNVSLDLGVTVAARIKCYEAAGTLTHNFGISRSGVGGMFVLVKPDQVQLVNGIGIVRASYPADGTGYNTYHLTGKNATPGNTGSAVWRLYRNGVEVVTVEGAGGSISGLNGLFAGHYGTSATGTWYFDWIAGRDDGAFTPAQWNPVPGNPTAAPVITSPGIGTTVTSQSAPIQWTGDAHNGYQVRLNKTNDPSDGSMWDSGRVTSSGNSCTATPIENGQLYVFARLRNATGWGPWSAPGHHFIMNAPSTLPGAPDVVLPHAGAVVQTQHPIAQWIGDSHNMYQIRVNTTNSPDDAVIWDSGPIVSVASSGEMGPLPTGSLYAFVRLHTVAGWGPWTPGKAFQVDTPVDLMRGWVLLRDDLNTQLAALSKAREYRVNHVQISHDLMMYRHEPINDTERRWRINQLIDAAHANGVEEVVLWVHEADFVNMPAQYNVGGKLNMDAPGYWTWLDSQYETLFNVCPNADGLVLTFTENFTGVDICDPSKRIHAGKTPEDSLTEMIRAIWNVCKRRNKSLYVRTWTNSGGADRWVRNAVLRNDPAIWMFSKPTGAADYNVIQESYDIIGTATGHREMVEFDVVGEYWGLTTVPWAGIDYIKQHWSNFALPRGARGIVARVDRDDGKVIQTPNRINMYTLDVIADYPHAPTEDIYRYWTWNWFGETAGNRVASALKRSYDIANACYYLPTVYHFSREVARDYCLKSLFDYDYVNSILKSQSNFQPGAGTDYSVLRNQMATAAGMLGISPIPNTLFGDFSPAYFAATNPMCTVAVVDATYGIKTSSFAANSVQYSTDGGTNWTNVAYTWTATGAMTDPYIITVNSVPFGSRAAGKNKIRFRATNNNNVTSAYSTYTVRGLDQAIVTLGSSIDSDGLYHPQGGDGDTISATMGGRSCRRLASSSESNFYFQVDDGFAYDRSPSSIYLQVDYYGSSGSITPIYDSVERTDETLSPVYLNGGSGWRQAVWRLDDVNFGNRLSSSSDFRLFIGGDTGVYISHVRLFYAQPGGTLDRPTNLQASAPSASQVSLTWNGVAGATLYQVSRGGTHAGWALGTGFTDSGLSPNSQHTYTVTAYAGANTSPASDPRVVTTLAATPAVTCNKAAETWHTSNNFAFTAVNGFGSGRVAYYRYAWTESPTHEWTGAEASWPSVDPPAEASGWSTWLPTYSPTDPASGWLLYEGSTTQRLTWEEMVEEDGVPAWKYSDQGRVYNTKTKIARWPIVPIDLNVGATYTIRMKAADSPLGWLNNGVNIGFNTFRESSAGAIIRPDRLQLSSESGNSSTVSPDNGYSYHTYTLIVKNAVYGNNSTTQYHLYRDGQYLLSVQGGVAPEPSPFHGPTFGHTTSNALGTWYYQWMAWRNDGAFPPAPPDFLTMTAPYFGSSFYLHLRAYNADGKPGETIALGPYRYWDGTTPIPPQVTDNGSFTTRNAIKASWTMAGPNITRYDYAVGTSPGSQNVLPWTSAGLAMEVSRTDLNLTDGQTYFLSARGIAGPTTGHVGSSDGITVAPHYARIGQARNIGDHSPVAFYDKTVTAVFPDSVYIQEPAGAGIKVICDHPVQPGNAVDLAGTMYGAGGERALIADTVVARESGAAVRPVFMTNKAIGGSGIVPHVPELVPPSTGPSNMSKLATVSGVVRHIDYQGNAFEIDDGSGVMLKCLLPGGSCFPQINRYVVVTGIVSIQQGEFGLTRALRVRHGDSVQQF